MLNNVIKNAASRTKKMAGSFLIVSTALQLLLINPAFAGVEQWSQAQINQWYSEHGVPIGSNFVPASASNQLEMWQADTFDLARIDLELGWAEKLGMNTMRVFLHDLPWKNDRVKFIERIHQFLEVAKKHNIRPMMVLLDSVWDPYPKAGPQLEPKPGVHNSRWVQSPGIEVLSNEARYGEIQSYVTGIISEFKDDSQIASWDVWNEPDNLNIGSYNEEPVKLEYVEKLIPKVFHWAREANPSQPLTSGIWAGDWHSHESLKPIERLQVELSDFISFHAYGDKHDFANRAQQLSRYGRPVVNTEYMARPFNSTFKSIMEVALPAKVGLYNWGFVAGRSQTNYPWDSWKEEYGLKKPLKEWFHDIFHYDGTPYIPSEIEDIKGATCGDKYHLQLKTGT